MWLAVAQVSCCLPEAEEEGDIPVPLGPKTGGADRKPAPRHSDSSDRQAGLECDEPTTVTARQRRAQVSERQPLSYPQSEGPGGAGGPLEGDI